MMNIWQGLGAIVVIVVVTLLPGSAWEQAEGATEPAEGPEPDVGDAVAVEDSVTRTDVLTWDDRGKDRRGVVVTLTIPRGRSLVAIEPIEADSGLGGEVLEFVRINSTLVLDPSKLRRIRFRAVDGGESKVTISVRLKRCAPLRLAVREYVGDIGIRRVLEQDHDFPNCCPTSLAAAPTAEDAQATRSDRDRWGS